MLKQTKSVFLLFTILVPAMLMGATINVTDAPYNADNTGNSDATEALQDALDDATAAGDNVYLPAGVYMISDTLEVSNNLNDYQILIKGDGRVAETGTVIRATASMDNMLLHHGNKIYLYKIRFEGNNLAKTIIKSGTATMDGTHLPKLKILVIDGSTEDAILSSARMRSNGIETGNIDDLIISNCGMGIRWFGNAQEGYADGNGDADTKVIVNELRIRYTGGCYTPGGLTVGYHFGKFNIVEISDAYCSIGNHPDLTTSVGDVYERCIMNGGYYYGIQRGPTVGKGGHNFIIENNIIENCDKAISTDLRVLSSGNLSAIHGEGIGDSPVDGKTLGGIIRNNIIKNCSRAWFCQGDDIVFTGNEIENTPGGDYYDGHNTGILRFNGSLNCVIGEENVITGLSNKRIIYATYNIAEPDEDEISLIYFYESLNDFEATTSSDYILPDSEIIIMP